MDDTAEIASRLDRIDALARTGASRSELLVEVRGLLDDGFRASAVPERGGAPERGPAASSSPGGEARPAAPDAVDGVEPPGPGTRIYGGGVAVS